MQKIQTENSERQKTISQLQHDIEELQQIKNRANEAFSNLQTLILRLDDLKAQINQESQALTDLTKEFEEKQKSEKELRTQLENLRTEISRFDISEFENARTRSRQALQQYTSL
jgi:chromosome segregation ATPase